MDSFMFRDIRAQKANAISRHRRIQRITTLFRFLELFVFLIILSRYSTRFAFSLINISSGYFRGVSVTLISPRFVFLAGNAIVAVLFLRSGQFSAEKGENGVDFYDEYIEICRNNQQKRSEEEKKTSGVCIYGGDDEEENMSRCKSEKLESSARGEERRRNLRPSMSDKSGKSNDRGRKAAKCGGCAEDEMSSDEFRRTVEAFIARQLRFLREEEEEGVFSI